MPRGGKPAQAAVERRPAEAHGEEELQHDAEPEARDGEPGDGDDAQGVVEHRVAPERGDDAEGNADDDRERPWPPGSARWWRAAGARGRRRSGAWCRGSSQVAPHEAGDVARRTGRAAADRSRADAGAPRTCAGVAVSPATSATGSAGITREITNVTTSSPSSVGTNHGRRWSTSARSLMAQRPRGRATAPRVIDNDQRISCPLPMGLKRMPSRFLAHGPKYFVL